MLKHYITFLFPNDPTKIEEAFEVKVQTRKISKRDLALVLANRPANAYAFYFFDRFEEVINGEYLIGMHINKTMIFHLGPAYTFEEIQKQFPEEASELEPIFQNEKWEITTALRTCYNSWIFLRKGAVVI